MFLLAFVFTTTVFVVSGVTATIKLLKSRDKTNTYDASSKAAGGAGPEIFSKWNMIELFFEGYIEAYLRNWRARRFIYSGTFLVSFIYGIVNTLILGRPAEHVAWECVTLILFFIVCLPFAALWMLQPWYKGLNEEVLKLLDRVAQITPEIDRIVEDLYSQLKEICRGVLDLEKSNMRMDIRKRIDKAHIELRGIVEDLYALLGEGPSTLREESRLEARNEIMEILPKIYEMRFELNSQLDELIRLDHDCLTRSVFRRRKAMYAAVS
jgi:hypothetical protein